MMNKYKVNLDKKQRAVIYNRVDDEFRRAVLGYSVKGSIREDWDTYKPTIEKYKLDFEFQGVKDNRSKTKFVFTANDLIGHLYHVVTGTRVNERGDERYINQEYNSKKKGERTTRYHKYTGGVVGFAALDPETSEVVIDSIDITDVRQLL